MKKDDNENKKELKRRTALIKNKEEQLIENIR
jgi:hypothetical protein